MTTTLARPVEERVTHTHTSEDGVVLVITGVPALVLEDENGVRQVAYKGASSRVVTNYIRQALELFTSPAVHSVSFEEASRGLSIHAQIRFAGPKVNLNRFSIEDWREVTNLLYRGYKEIGTSLKEIRGSRHIPYPNATVSSGSVIFSLKAEAKESEQVSLFGEELTAEEKAPEEVQILQLLIDGFALVSGRSAERVNPLLGHPQIRLATVKAIELLSPRDKSDIEEVQIIPKSEAIARTEVVVFTPATYQKAKHIVAELKANPIDEEKDRRNVTIIGQIKVLSRAGRITIDKIELNHPEGSKHPTAAIFVDRIFTQLTDFFKNKKRVLFRGIEYRTNEKWTSEPWIMEVEEAPLEEEVSRLASSLPESA